MLRNITKEIFAKQIIPAIAISADGETAANSVEYAGKYVGFAAKLVVSTYVAGTASLKVEVKKAEDLAFSLVDTSSEPTLTSIGEIDINLSDYDAIQGAKEVKISLVGANSANFTASVLLYGENRTIENA